MTSVVFGASLAVAGTGITAVGNHLVSLSHSLAKPKVTYRGRLFFFVGNACIILLGTGFGLGAMAFAPQSIVAPLGGLTIVWNLLLDGKVSPEQLAASCLTLVGMTWVVYIGPSGNTTRKQSFTIFEKRSFHLVCLLYVAIGTAMERTSSKLWRKLAAGAVGGLVGGLGNVFAKSAVEFHAGNQLKSEQDDSLTFSLVALIALLLATGQITLFNYALANYPVVSVVPVYTTSLMLSATISGGVAFDEFADFTLSRYVAFASGLIICIVGVAFLSASTAAMTEEELKD